jgi:hypothetical protein
MLDGCPLPAAIHANHFVRRSISSIISSAQRTASAIALTVAGARVPPSYIASLRAARIEAAIRRNIYGC